MTHAVNCESAKEVLRLDVNKEMNWPLNPYSGWYAPNRKLLLLEMIWDSPALDVDSAFHCRLPSLWRSLSPAPHPSPEPTERTLQLTQSWCTYDTNSCISRFYGASESSMNLLLWTCWKRSSLCLKMLDSGHEQYKSLNFMCHSCWPHQLMEGSGNLAKCGNSPVPPSIWNHARGSHFRNSLMSHNKLTLVYSDHKHTHTHTSTLICVQTHTHMYLLGKEISDKRETGKVLVF